MEVSQMWLNYYIRFRSWRKVVTLLDIRNQQKGKNAFFLHRKNN